MHEAIVFELLRQDTGVLLDATLYTLGTPEGILPSDPALQGEPENTPRNTRLRVTRITDGDFIDVVYQRMDLSTLIVPPDGVRINVGVDTQPQAIAKALAALGEVTTYPITTDDALPYRVTQNWDTIVFRAKDASLLWVAH
jgi:hypothetical protein